MHWPDAFSCLMLEVCLSQPSCQTYHLTVMVEELFTDISGNASKMTVLAWNEA